MSSGSPESSNTPPAPSVGAPTPPAQPGFRELGLPDALLRALDTLGYETPSPIQARTIPLLLAGRDILGQAQTGTGKTAAFALPVLAKLDLTKRIPQVLVLTPTRELALQVAEAFQKYAANMPGFHVLPVYGGQSYPIQLRSLQRGVHVVVGTPGRVMDHIRRGSLDLSGISYMVLDEADEMLRMGFLEDVTWILDQTPPARQTALFSATLPGPVRRIAQKQMHDPTEITIETHAATANLIRQRYWIVSGTHKLDALTRILEAEAVDGMLVFVRTRTMTVELAERLEARGYACAPLSGDVAQAVRERTVDRFKGGGLDILVATDVAARGLDVDRVSHVVNFDVPTDTESYVHRIGRTGRAGRKGDAILFVSPRERHMLHAIERTIGRRIEPMALPTAEEVAEQRIMRFKLRIADTIEGEEDLSTYADIVTEFVEEHEVEPIVVAAALARMAQGDRPLRGDDGRQSGPSRGAGDSGHSSQHAPASSAPPPAPRPQYTSPPAPGPQTAAPQFSAPPSQPREPSSHFVPPPRRDFDAPPFDPRRDEQREDFRGPPRGRTADGGLETFRIEVGLSHGVRPANIVGAIANEAGIEGRAIGRIEIYDDYSTVDLPLGMPNDLLNALGGVFICGQPLRMTRADSARRHSGGWGGRNAGPPQRGGPPERGGFRGPPRR